MIEEAEYAVTITIRLYANINFAPMERDGPITHLDAIANAIGSMPTKSWEDISSGFGGEFAEPNVDFAVSKVYQVEV